MASSSLRLAAEHSVFLAPRLHHVLAGGTGGRGLFVAVQDAHHQIACHSALFHAGCSCTLDRLLRVVVRDAHAGVNAHQRRGHGDRECQTPDPPPWPDPPHGAPITWWMTVMTPAAA